MANDSDIQSLIANFAEQLTQVIRRKTLEQVLAALGGEASAAPARRGPGRPRSAVAPAARPARRAKGAKRSAAEMEQFTDDLVAFVRANPGLRGEQIAAALKTDVKTMRLPMQKLIEGKKISTKGQRRGMTYFPAGGGASAPKAEAPAKKKSRRRGKKKAA